MLRIWLVNQLFDFFFAGGVIVSFTLILELSVCILSKDTGVILDIMRTKIWETGLQDLWTFDLRQIATWFWQNLKITCVGFSVPVTATLWTIVFFPLHVVTKCPTWWTYFSAHWKKGQSGYCNGPLQIHIYDPIPTLVFHTLKGMVKNELQ